MYICICHGVNDRTIARAVRGGAHSIDDVAEELAVTTCCGSCTDDVRRVIENTLGCERMVDVAELAHDAAG